MINLDPNNTNTNPSDVAVDPTAGISGAPVTQDPVVSQVPAEPTAVEPVIPTIVSEEPTVPETPAIDPMVGAVTPGVSPMPEAPVNPTVDLGGIATPNLTGTPTVEEPVTGPAGVVDEPTKTQL